MGESAGILLILFMIAQLKTWSPYLVGRAAPDAAGKARPTVNHVIVMNYVKLNKQDEQESKWGAAFSLDKTRPHSGWRLLHEMVIDGVAHQFGVVAQMHFQQDTVAVGADGFSAQCESIGNFRNGFG